MAKDAATIYIDDSAIWVLLAKGREAQKLASSPLERGLVKDGVVHDEDAVASKVRELWATQGIGARRVVAAISGINCLYRLITLPELSKELLPEAIKREAGRALGVPLQEVHLSWQTLPSLRGETVVYLAASPRNAVDSLVSALRKAGLDPYLMDLKPLAIARCATEPRAIIVDLQPRSFDTIIMAEGIPQVVRSIPLVEEAAVEERVSFVREEVDRAITFYDSGHGDNPLGSDVPLLVSGELAEQQDTWNLIVHRQERTVQVLPLPMALTEGFPPGQYATNVGLALKEVLASEKGAIAYSLVNFNALPEAYRPKPRKLSEILFMPTIVGGLALVAVGAFFIITTMAHNDDLRAQLAAINQMAISSHVTAQEIATLTQQVTSLEISVNSLDTTLREFDAERDEINEDLGQVNSSLPGNVELQSVDHKGNSLTVTGKGDDRDAVFRYGKNLRASGRFALVVITEIDEEGYFQLDLSKET
jgi:type IV pilus assembly protein PilM